MYGKYSYEIEYWSKQQDKNPKIPPTQKHQIQIANQPIKNHSSWRRFSREHQRRGEEWRPTTLSNMSNSREWQDLAVDRNSEEVTTDLKLVISMSWETRVLTVLLPFWRSPPLLVGEWMKSPLLQLGGKLRPPVLISASTGSPISSRWFLQWLSGSLSSPAKVCLDYRFLKIHLQYLHIYWYNETRIAKKPS